MSHKTSINTKINNKVSLEKALKRLGISYKQNTTTKGNYGVHEKCDIVLEKYGNSNLNDSVGLRKLENGSYEFTGDFFGLTDENGKRLNENNFKDRIENAYNFENINERLNNINFNLDDTNIDFSQKEINYVMNRMV